VTKRPKVRASEPTPARPMTAVPPVARRRQAAPVELARALAAARGRERAAEAARAAQEHAQAAEADAALAARLSTPPDRAADAEPVLDRRSLREKARAHDGVAEVLVFTVGDERFGIDLGAVEEAIDLPPVHHVPEMPTAMEGVITVRGTLTSVYSPRQALGVAHTTGACALIFRRKRSRLALIIDDVEDARSMELSHLRDAPTSAAAGVVLGVLRQDDVLCSLVDGDALLAACQATSVPEFP
jgi:purine-binding chemotaxis protein CheW